MDFTQKKLESWMTAARLLIEENPAKGAPEPSRRLGYAYPGPFSSAFKKYHDRRALQYRKEMKGKK